MTHSDPQIQEIIDKLDGTTLTREEEKYLKGILQGEIKLEFGNREQVELIRKLKSIDDILSEGGFDVDELKTILKDKVDDYEDEIYELQSQISNIESKQRSIEDILQKLPTI